MEFLAKLMTWLSVGYLVVLAGLFLVTKYTKALEPTTQLQEFGLKIAAKLALTKTWARMLYSWPGFLILALGFGGGWTWFVFHYAGDEYGAFMGVFNFWVYSKLAVHYFKIHKYMKDPEVIAL